GIAGLRQAGFRVGIAGNQPPGVAEALKALSLGADFIATSAQWGVSKPEAEFFARVLAATGAAPAEIAYVGDRIDNDVEPARAAGMRPVFLPRGHWGEVHDLRERGDCLRITALTELAERLTCRA